MAPIAADLSTKLGISLTPTGINQPWVDGSARSARAFGDGELAALAPLGRNLTSLDLAGTAVTDAGLAVVSHMPNLRQLRLERTRVTDAGLDHLSKLSHLESLNLYGTAVTDAGLKALQPLPTLTKLYVWRTRVTPAAAAEFVASRVDEAREREWEGQIAELRAKIARQHTAVVDGVAVPPPTTSRTPTSRPATTATAGR